MKALLILGNQLFAPELFKEKLKSAQNVVVFMREDFELCNYYQFHKHKIIFTLAAMRSYGDELKKTGFELHYEELRESKRKYEEHLVDFLNSRKITEVLIFEIEDKFFETRILSTLASQDIRLNVLESPMFFTSRGDFKNYLKKVKKPFMKSFYEGQRKTLEILIDQKGKPIGGKWSFDSENRLPLPLDQVPPSLPVPKITQTVVAATQICETYFNTRPGDSKNFWLPVDRKGARAWLRDFVTQRLESFGPYEDAIPTHSDFVFHSVLTPLLNVGLLTPDQIVQEVLNEAARRNLSIQSTEGFIRQVIGWREFIRGIYQNFSEQQDTANFWNHQRQLTHHWYSATTGIPPLDSVIKKVIKYGYAHHIERLMIVGSLMLLLEIDPKEAHRWFMEMFVDSSDWVMGPNVYGMALFSDGGIFATKPYICGSNYYRKMGGYKRGSWCDGVDGLYWQFIEKHKAFFLKNPRLSMIARTVEKMDPARKKLIFKEADAIKDRITKVN